MAGNFWQSSHWQQWILDRQDILYERSSDLKLLTDEEYQKIMIFFASIIQALGEQLKVKQQVIATATIYFRRFYSRNSLRSIDPLLLAPTSLFLASKVEEFGMMSHTKLIGTIQSLIKTKFNYAYSNMDFPYRMQHIFEAEFFLLEQMDCCLIIYHPYRSLLQFFQDLQQDESLSSLSWKFINDSLRTDVSILYPPYQIALACLHLASVIVNKEKDLRQWFAELAVDMQKVLEIERYILALHHLWRSFDEKKEMPTILQKMPKPKIQPSRPPSEAGNSNSGVDVQALLAAQQQQTPSSQTASLL
uniref:Cyclin-like domain-containing protein n=1 Tax=Romanomermis culicivorax TaxID=13658 RepID=A0A915IDD3_ROMCU